MSGWTVKSLQCAIPNLAATFESSADELNTLDGQLGDGDLGITMVRGTRGLVEVSDDLPDDLGLALLKCAQAFTRVSASSYGTLLATGLMAAAKDSKSQTERPWSDLSPVIHMAATAMLERGKGHLGAKTVVDAVYAVAQNLAGIDDPLVALSTAKKAVSDTLEKFRNRPCELGRARIFADKSIGLDDPGMVAFQRLVEALG